MHKLGAAILTGALTLGTAVPVMAGEDRHESNGQGKNRFESQFKDWNTQFWGNESLARMVTKGVIKGGDDSTVAANRPVSRLEAAIMVSRLLNLRAPANAGGKMKIKNQDGEWEVKDEDQIPSWGREFMRIGLEYGFLPSEGASLHPMAPLNRLEAAVMLVKAAGLDAEAQAKADAELIFTDASEIPAQLKGYIAIAVEKGFILGREDGTYKPGDLVSRAEWAALLDRLDRQRPSDPTDARQVKGSVTAVAVGSAPSITMTTPAYPGGVTYTVDDTAVFYKKGKAITIADVAAGDQVIINLSADRKILMVTVNNPVRQVQGQVTAFAAPTATAVGSITVDEKGTGVTYSVAAQTEVTLADKAATLADVKVGDRVSLTIEGTKLTKIGIKVEKMKVTGTVSAVTPGTNDVLPTIAVTGANNSTATYSVADYVVINNAAGAAVTLVDLKVGDKVTMGVERNVAVTIRVGEPTPSEPGKSEAPFEFEGKIVSLDLTARTIAIKPKRGDEQNLKLDANVKVQAGRRGVKLADLKAGDRVEVKGRGETILKIELED